MAPCALLVAAVVLPGGGTYNRRMDKRYTRVVISSHNDRPVPAKSLKNLFEAEPWWPERSIEQLEHVLKLYPAVGAWDGEILVGFARAVTDSEFRGYIEDVLVLREYRGGGVGRRMTGLLMEALDHIDVVTLFCQRKLVSYYESLGFKEFSRQVVMQKRNRR